MDWTQLDGTELRMRTGTGTASYSFDISRQNHPSSIIRRVLSSPINHRNGSARITRSSSQWWLLGALPLLMIDGRHDEAATQKRVNCCTRIPTDSAAYPELNDRATNLLAHNTSQVSTPSTDYVTQSNIEISRYSSDGLWFFTRSH